MDSRNGNLISLAEFLDMKGYDPESVSRFIRVREDELREFEKDQGKVDLKTNKPLAYKAAKARKRRVQLKIPGRRRK